MKKEVLVIRIDEKDKTKIEKLAKQAGADSVSAYVRSKACGCGEAGYEGIFRRIDWTCQKCGRANSWKR